MAIHLVLLRHAPAEVRDPARWPDDAARPLTKAGRADARRVADGLRETGLRPAIVATSPAARCVVTAEIAAERLSDGAAPAVERWPELAFSGTAQGIVDRLSRERLAGRSCLLVGHEPLLGRLAGLLVFGEDVPALRLRRAGACSLLMPRAPVAGSGRVDWLLTRGQLARLGASR